MKVSRHHFYSNKPAPIHVTFKQVEGNVGKERTYFHRGGQSAIIIKPRAVNRTQEIRWIRYYGEAPIGIYYLLNRKNALHSITIIGGDLPEKTHIKYDLSNPDNPSVMALDSGGNPSPHNIHLFSLDDLPLLREFFLQIQQHTNNINRIIGTVNSVDLTGLPVPRLPYALAVKVPIINHL